MATDGPPWPLSVHKEASDAHRLRRALICGGIGYTSWCLLDHDNRQKMVEAYTAPVGARPRDDSPAKTPPPVDRSPKKRAADRAPGPPPVNRSLKQRVKRQRSPELFRADDSKRPRLGGIDDAYLWDHAAELPHVVWEQMMDPALPADTQPHMVLDDTPPHANPAQALRERGVVVKLEMHELYQRDLDTLQPGRWLSCNVIDAYFEVLSVHCPRNFALRPTTDVRPCQSIEGGLRARLNPDVTHALFPANVRESHWVLLEYIRGKDFQVFNIYNPKSPEYDDDAMAITARLNWHLTGSRTDVAVRICPRQDNDVDCGVYVCWYATAIMNTMYSREMTGTRFAAIESTNWQLAVGPPLWFRDFILGRLTEASLV